MKTRRDFIKTVGLGSAALCVPFKFRGRDLLKAAVVPGTLPLDPALLQKFGMPLYVPPNTTSLGLASGPAFLPLAPGDPDYIAGYTNYRIYTSECVQQMAQYDPVAAPGLTLPPTTVWGYGPDLANISFPGPTLLVKKNEKVHVKWINAITATTFNLEGYDYGDGTYKRAYDPYLEGCKFGEPEIRMVPHVHGAHVEAKSDGYPYHWVTNDPLNNSLDYYYDNIQDACTIWYHDHTIGMTRLNVYMGPAGFWVIVDDAELAGTDIPFFPFQYGLALQDRFLNTDGSLHYPIRDSSVIPTSVDHPGPWVPECFGDIIIVNGVAWPYLNVEPRRYRFRLLGGSQARMWNLELVDSDITGTPTGAPSLPFVVIGTEGGFLTNPAVYNTLLLTGAERADCILDFTGLAGKTFTMTNNGNAPYPFGDPVSLVPTTAMVMQFRVNLPLSSTDNTVALTAAYNLRSGLPGAPSNTPFEILPEAGAVETRDFLLQEFMDMDPLVGAPMMMKVNDQMLKVDPIYNKPVQGTSEIWRFINTTVDAHPMHTHLFTFQVLGRRPFDKQLFYDNNGMNANLADLVVALNDPNSIYWTGPEVGPLPHETGWKDTVKSMPDEVTRVIMKLAPDEYLGKYMVHCHIVEHEDNAMMIGFEVVPPVNKVAGVNGAGVVLWFDPQTVHDEIFDKPVTELTPVPLWENQGSKLVGPWGVAPDILKMPIMDPAGNPNPLNGIDDFRGMMKFTESLVYGESSILEFPASPFITSEWPDVLSAPNPALLPQLSKNLFVAFKPSSLVNNVPQTVFEAGGVISGFNVYVQSGYVVMGIWNRVERYFVETLLEANTVYLAHLEFNADTLKCRMVLNGVASAWFDFRGFQLDLSTGSIGGSSNGTAFRNVGVFNDRGRYFDGYIGDVRLDSGTMPVDYLTQIYTFYSNRYGTPNLPPPPTAKSSAWTIYNESEKLAVNTNSKLNVYPNPFSNNATVEFHLPEGQRLNIELVDMSGNKIVDIHNGRVAGGKNSFSIKGRSLTPGSYAVRVTGDSFAAIERVVIAR